MPNIRRFLGLCVLSCYITGCAGGYRTVDLSPTDTDSGVGDGNVPVLKTGDGLRLVMRNGVAVTGKLVRIEDQELFLRDALAEGGSRDTFAELPGAEDAGAAEPVSYALADIVRIERFESNAGVNLAIAGVLIGSMACMIYAMDHVLDDFGEP